jgi:hypothetical protein
MQNAHERFGLLEFVKRTKDTTTRVRVHLDRAILEPRNSNHDSASAHLLSMIGGDSEIGALSAAVAEGGLFRIEFPDHTNVSASLGPDAQCFRGSVMVPGRKRPVRHLVAVSAELAKTKPGTDREGPRTILCDDDPVFILYRIAGRYGLPAVPEWAPWFVRELKRGKAIMPLVGFACSPVLVKGNKQTFLKWISRALKERVIHVPEVNSSISWKLTHSVIFGGDANGNEHLVDSAAQPMPLG